MRNPNPSPNPFHYLPPGLDVQPCYQGIIIAVKKQCKTQMLLDLARHVPSVEAFKKNRELAKQKRRLDRLFGGLRFSYAAHVFYACHSLSRAWLDTSSNSIANCWQKAQCLPAEWQHKNIQLRKNNDELTCQLEVAMKSFQALSLRICDKRNADPSIDDAPEPAPLLGRL